MPQVSIAIVVVAVLLAAMLVFDVVAALVVMITF